MRTCSLLLSLLVLLVPAGEVAAASAPAGAQAYATPRFEDANRRKKIEAMRPEIDAVYRDFAAERHVPGVVYGVVLDGDLVHAGAVGFAHVERKIPAATDTRFRIASMTKSFVALAILQLRDAGQLALHDPVEKYLPEFGAVPSLTRDAPVITLRHLLTMTAGFPEDNPWGDRQLEVTAEALREFVRGGVSRSNSPGIAYEYSNFSYALLGQIVAKASGEPFQRYITRTILTPLGMRDTRWEFTDVPGDKLALGYRWEHETWQLEPMLHDGTYGAMGGLLTTLPDFARYASLHLAAWPARDNPENDIVRRATLREMHKPAEVTGIVADAKTLAGEPAPVAVGYGYGLRWAMDHRNQVNVGHSGGLPGFGSNFRCYPEHGFAIISFANLTYAGMSAVNARVGALLLEKARLPARVVPASGTLAQRQQEIVTLLSSWDDALSRTVVAENFFLDRSREEWRQRSREVLAQAGAIVQVGALHAENQLRGSFPLIGKNGRIEVFFTLTPEKLPRVQELRLTFVKTP